MTYSKHAFCFVFNFALLLELQCKYAPYFPLHIPHYNHFKVFSMQFLLPAPEHTGIHCLYSEFGNENIFTGLTVQGQKLWWQATASEIH